MVQWRITLTRRLEKRTILAEESMTHSEVAHSEWCRRLFNYIVGRPCSSRPQVGVYYIYKRFLVWPLIQNMPRQDLRSHTNSSHIIVINLTYQSSNRALFLAHTLDHRSEVNFLSSDQRHTNFAGKCISSSATALPY